MSNTHKGPKKMLVFVFEFIMGGGLLEEAFPQYTDDATKLWHASIDDLSALHNIQILTMHDDRLPDAIFPINPEKIESIRTNPKLFRQHYQSCLDRADAVWLIAPEADNTLALLAQEVLDSNKILLGSHPDAILLTTDKYATCKHLNKSKIETIPTFKTLEPLLSRSTAVIAKPIDGVGCESTLYFSSPQMAQKWAASNNTDQFIFQEYIAGTPLSLSIVCYNLPESKYNIQCDLLCVNQQLIDVDFSNGRLLSRGVSINMRADTDGCYKELASQVVSSIPGLWGYVGIDLIDTKTKLVVVEINPRITLSYTELHTKLNINPANKILNLPQIPNNNPSIVTQ